MAPRLTLLEHNALGRHTKARLRKDYKLQNLLDADTTLKDMLSFGFFRNQKEFYRTLVEDYNKIMTVKRAERDITNKQKVAARRRAKKQPRERTFIFHMTYRCTIYNLPIKGNGSYYDTNLDIRYKLGVTYSWNITSCPNTTNNPTKFIKEFLEIEAVYDDGYKLMELVKYTIEYMEDPPTHNRPVTHQPMTRAFALKNDWLKYSHGIAQSAYNDSEGKCVYHQLDSFLNNPPTGRPTKFICKENTSQKALYHFFERWAHEQAEWYDHFDMNSGVSIEMIAELCRSIKRNMYAYDGDDKLIYSVTSESSKKYCPIVFTNYMGTVT